MSAFDQNDIVVTDEKMNKSAFDENDVVSPVMASRGSSSANGGDASSADIKKAGEFSAGDTFLQHLPQGALFGSSDEIIGAGASIVDPWQRVLNKLDVLDESPSQILDRQNGQPETSLLDDVGRAVTKGNPMKFAVPGYGYGNDQVNLLLNKMGIDASLPALQNDPVYSGVRDISREELQQSADQHPFPAFAGTMTGAIATIPFMPQALTNIASVPKTAGVVEKAIASGINSVPLSVITGAGMTNADNMPQQLEDIKQNVGVGGVISSAAPVVGAMASKVGGALKDIGNFVAPNFAIGKELGNKNINIMGKNASNPNSAYGQYYNSVADEVQSPISQSIEAKVSQENQGIGVAKLNNMTEVGKLEAQLAELKDTRARNSIHIADSEKAYYDAEINQLQTKVDDANTFVKDQKQLVKNDLIKNSSEQGATKIQNDLSNVHEGFKQDYEIIDKEIGNFIFDMNGPVSNFYNNPKVSTTLKLQPDKFKAMASEIQNYLTDPSTGQGGMNRIMFKDFVNGTDGKKPEFDNIIGKYFPELAPYTNEVKSNLRVEQLGQLRNSGNHKLEAAADILEATNEKFSKYKTLFDKFLPKDEYGNVISSPELTAGVKDTIESRYMPETQRNKASNFVQLMDEIPEQHIKDKIMANIEDANIDKINADSSIEKTLKDIEAYKKEIKVLSRELSDPSRVNLWRGQDLIGNANADDKIAFLNGKLVDEQVKLNMKLNEYVRGTKNQTTAIDKIISLPHSVDRDTAIANTIRSGDTLTNNSPLNQVIAEGQPNTKIDLASRIEHLQELIGLGRNIKEGMRGVIDPSSLAGDHVGRISAATTKSLSGIAGNMVGRTQNAFSDNFVTQLGSKMGIGPIANTPLLAPAVSSYQQNVNVPPKDEVGNDRVIQTMNGKLSLEELMSSISNKPLEDVMKLDATGQAALKNSLIQISPEVRKYLEEKRAKNGQP